MKDVIYLWAIIGIIIVTLFVPVCELTNYCPLVGYEIGTWSPFKQN